MAAATSRPDKVVGMHFFSPAHIMRLLENIRGKDTSPETMATAMDLGKRMKKVFSSPSLNEPPSNEWN